MSDLPAVSLGQFLGCCLRGHRGRLLVESWEGKERPRTEARHAAVVVWISTSVKYRLNIHLSSRALSTWHLSAVYIGIIQYRYLISILLSLKIYKISIDDNSLFYSLSKRPTWYKSMCLDTRRFLSEGEREITSSLSIGE
jgi:hypothetical protein